jgi:streptomycin 6-kinase
VNLPATWEDAGRPFEVTLLDTTLELLSTLAPSQGAQVLVHQDLHARYVLAAQSEPWLVIVPKPLAGELQFAVAPIIRGSERGPSGDAVAHRLDRLTDGLGLDRERALDWAIA